MVCPFAKNIMELFSRSIDMHISFHLQNLRSCHFCFTLKRHTKFVDNVPSYIVVKKDNDGFKIISNII